jgi:hypothetical protein
MKKPEKPLEIGYHFQLIGICCAIEDFKLCWYLNKEFQFDFERIEDLEIIHKGAQLFFPVFEYEDQELEITYHLLTNRSPNGFLIPEDKKADFFLKLSGEYTMINMQELMNKIRQLQSVIAVYPMNNARLKSAGNLLF